MNLIKINDYTKTETFRGGCLMHKAHIWKQLGANPVIMNIITKGRIPFTQKPPLIQFTKNLIEKYTTKTSPTMTMIIEDLKAQDILEIPPSLDRGFMSKMFLRKKSDGSMRPIFDLRGLNRFITTKHFQLISPIDISKFLQKNDWMTKIDLSQAYFHLPIAVSHRRFLRICYNNQVLQLKALPFGLCSAPRTFATVSNWIAEILRAKGIRTIVYLDDFLIANQNKGLLATQITQVLQILKELGWQINFKKSVLMPSQTIEYLGLVWKTQEGTLALPQEKIKKTKDILQKTLKSGKITLRGAQSLLGLLNFASITTPLGRLHCRQMQRFLRKFNKKSRTKKMVPIPAKKELIWWLDAIGSSSTTMFKKEVTHFLTTDAADAGWGAHLNDHYLTGHWTNHQKTWHSNMKELYAVYGAIKRKSQILKNTHILVQSDNRTLVAHIRNEGGTRSLTLLELTSNLLVLAEHLNITLSAAYLPGRYNGIADRLSRNKPVPEWHLLPQAAEAIFKRWGVPVIDLFASERAKVVAQYVTWDSRDGSAAFCDAFSRSWNYKLAWVFPPPNLIPRVLQHLNTAKGTFIVLAPMWTQCFWLADLQARALTEPYVLENLHSNLIDLTTGRSPTQVNNIKLQAWKIGGGLTRSLYWSASERQLLRKSWRDSTLTTYKAPINRWTTWCRLNNIDPKSPKGNDLARFLAKLHLEDHLAYRTILLHKSAIITYSAAEELTKNFFVQQVLKAISIMRPIERKEKIWDTEIIFNWLKETPNSGTLFEVSRRTAIILLLASGRRVHDLTLLDIAEENLIEKLDKSLILWPKFGSKTDNANARQSGWLLKQHSDLRLCPVKHVKELINVTLNRRLSENTDINSLFISITGKVKSATRTQIAGWIRTIFKEIDINAPPGSIRAAVASRSYSEQQPIEEILKRGNWRSAATFKKHYCRVVEKTNTATQVDHLAKQFLEV